MIMRSWLFVPGDSERKLEIARDNAADGLVLDLEDAVSDDRQDAGTGYAHRLSHGSNRSIEATTVGED
jgi:citrate lyase beta subunit